MALGLIPCLSVSNSRIKNIILLISGASGFSTELHNASSINVGKLNENGAIEVLNPEKYMIYYTNTELKKRIFPLGY